MAKELTAQFLNTMLADSERIFFASGGINTVIKLYGRDRIKVNEYTNFFQINFPGNNTLLTINKQVEKFGFAHTLHPNESRYVIKEESSIGYIFSKDSAEIMFDAELF